MNNEGLIVKDSTNNDRLAIVTDEYAFQGANPSSIYFEPNTSQEFILGTLHEGLGEAFLGFVDYHSGYFLISETAVVELRLMRMKFILMPIMPCKVMVPVYNSKAEITFI